MSELITIWLMQQFELPDRELQTPDMRIAADLKPEEIDYEEAKAQIERIANRLFEIAGIFDVYLDKPETSRRLLDEKVELHEEMKCCRTVVMLTPEFQQQLQALENQWEEENASLNEAALRAVRRHMPVNVKYMSDDELSNTLTPNGKFLPRAIAIQFKRTNVLQLIRTSLDGIERMHPAQLENSRVCNITLTERRALHAHIRPLGPLWEKNQSDKNTARKWAWFKLMRQNFKGILKMYMEHIAQYGPPENHHVSEDHPNGCPLLGKQCPIRADKVIDYMSGDYGWTEEAEYVDNLVTRPAHVLNDRGGVNSEPDEQNLNKRTELLEKEYQGNQLHVSEANKSCQAMDKVMDKMEFDMKSWIELSCRAYYNLNFLENLDELDRSILYFGQRAGMFGASADIRSSVECGLAEELYEASKEYLAFILNHMFEFDEQDREVEVMIHELREKLSELHQRNLSTLQQLNVARPDRTRKIKTWSDLQKEVEEKIGAPVRYASAPRRNRPLGGRRGGLLDALRRGGLLDALRGGRPGGRDGSGGRGGGRGRGGLLAFLAAQGRGRGSGGDDGAAADAGGREAMAARGEGS